MNTILPNIKSEAWNSDNTHKQVVELISKLILQETLNADEILYLLDHISLREMDYLFVSALNKKMEIYGNKVFLRSLIEISNYCKMGCKYCGINTFNKNVQRYRLTKAEIIDTCKAGYELGYRTFVFQGGEDTYFSDEVLGDIIHTVKEMFPDTRITLSLGERSKDSYRYLFDQGADRYLLRHETASRRLYEHLHPDFMSFDNRRECLKNLKDIGYQVGAGFMVGSPTQTNADLVLDLLYLKELDPHMVGIGPYLCHSETELRGNDNGGYIETLIMVALVRLFLPKVLLPATTALGTLKEYGREEALNVGANVIMPNIGPKEYRKQYEIYQGKICSTDVEIDYRDNLVKSIEAYDHVVDFGVGDYINFEKVKR